MSHRTEADVDRIAQRYVDGEYGDKRGRAARAICDLVCAYTGLLTDYRRLVKLDNKGGKDSGS